MKDEAAAVTVATSAVFLFAAAAAWRAMLRTGNADIRWVAAGLLVFGIKQAAKAWTLWSSVESGPWELAFSVVDLSAIGLVAWPFVRRWREGA